MTIPSTLGSFYVIARAHADVALDDPPCFLSPEQTKHVHAMLRMAWLRGADAGWTAAKAEGREP